MFTIFDQSKFQVAKVSDDQETITLWLEGKVEPIFITKEDELFEHNYKLVTKIKDGILATKLG